MGKRKSSRSIMSKRNTRKNNKLSKRRNSKRNNKRSNKRRNSKRNNRIIGGAIAINMKVSVPANALSSKNKLGTGLPKTALQRPRTGEVIEIGAGKWENNAKIRYTDPNKLGYGQESDWIAQSEMTPVGFVQRAMNAARALAAEPSAAPARTIISRDTRDTAPVGLTTTRKFKLGDYVKTKQRVGVEAPRGLPDRPSGTVGIVAYSDDDSDDEVGLLLSGWEKTAFINLNKLEPANEEDADEFDREVEDLRLEVDEGERDDDRSLSLPRPGGEGERALPLSRTRKRKRKMITRTSSEIALPLPRPRGVRALPRLSGERALPRPMPHPFRCLQGHRQRSTASPRWRCLQEPP